MSLKNLKDAELNKLLDEVAQDLNKAFGDVQNKLAKGEGKQLEGDQSGKMVKDEIKPKGPEESSPVAEGSDAPPDAPPADDAGSAAPAPSPDPSAGAPGGDPAQEMGAQLTPEALQAEYAKLPPEELQMHLQAAQAALAALGGGMGAPDAGPPAPEAAAPAPSPSASAPLLQSEKGTNSAALKKTEEAQMDELSKAELDAVKAENKSLKEDVEIIAATLKKMIETPVRKAITSIAELPKGEEEAQADETYKPLDPTNFWKKLAEVSKRPDLKKGEKKLILDIYAKQVEPEAAAKQLAKLFKAE